MNDAITHPALALWANFYLITGSAAAALTGLQFIVQTLLASDMMMNALPQEDPEGGIAAFGSPTVVHFANALVISVVLCAPWPGFGVLRATLAVIAISALAYAVIVMRRTRRQRGYTPTLYDVTWHLILPTLAYAALLVSAVLLGPRGPAPFFVLGASTLLLLCVGIHNSWDTVTYFTLQALRRAR